MFNHHLREEITVSVSPTQNLRLLACLRLPCWKVASVGKEGLHEAPARALVFRPEKVSKGVEMGPVHRVGEPYITTSPWLQHFQIRLRSTQQRLGGEWLREGVTSEGRGDGTTSTVCLPAAPLPGGAAEPGQAPAPPRAPAPPSGTWLAAAPGLFHLSQHSDPAHTACFLPHSPAKVHGESTSFSR